MALIKFKQVLFEGVRDVSFLIQNSINEALSKLGFSINRANSLYFRNRTRNRNFDTTENILY